MNITLKKGMSFLYEIIVVFSFVSILNIGYNIGFSNLFSEKYAVNENVEIISTTGIDTSGEMWRTINDDPNIIIKHEPDTVLILNIEFEDDKTQWGTVYYADNVENFTENYVISYAYVSGENVIEINDDFAQYLRLDITNNNNVNFKILSKKSETLLAYRINRLHWFLSFGIAILLIILYKLLKTNYEIDNVSKIFWFIIIFSVVGIFGRFFIGNAYYIYTDIGSDTFAQYYPYYVNEVISIRNGTFSTWNWDYGLGTSILNMAAWTFDPYAILLVLLGVIFGPGSVHYLLVWMQIAKIVTLFIVGKKFLAYYLKNNFAINLGAYMLSLNGYLLLWGQHYFLGTACIYMILIFYAIENYIHNECKKGGYWISITIGGLLIYSYYIGYMILTVACVYFIYRYFTVVKFEESKQIIVHFVKSVLYVLSGILLSGIVFIPASYYVITNSSRLIGATNNIFEKLRENFLSSFNVSDFSSRLTRLLSNNFLYINDNSNTFFSNYYETPELFSTIFIFFFFGQWIVYEIQKARESKKCISFILKIVLLYLLIFNSVTGVILNGFAYAAYRYTFLVFPFISICIGIVWQEVFCKKKLSFWGIEIGTVLTLWACLYSFNNCSDEVRNYVILISVLLATGRLLLLYIHMGKGNTQKAICLFVLLLVSTTVLDSSFTTNNRDIIEKNEYSLSWDYRNMLGDTASAIEWIKNHDNSFFRLEKTYSDWAIHSDSMLESYSTVTWYNSTPNSKLVDFYNNIYPNAATSFDSVKFFKLETELDQKANDIVNTKYLLSNYEIENNHWELLNQIGNTLIYKNRNSDSIAKWFGKTIPKDQFMLLTEEAKVSVLTDTVVTDNEVNVSESATANIGSFTLNGQQEMDGQIECSDAGILMIAIPDQEGWEVYVDGNKTPSINCDYGFIGVNLEAGKHNIAVKYHVPYAKAGIMISIAGFLLLVGLKICEKISASSLK